MTSAIPQTGVSVKGYIYYHLIATHNCDYLPLGLVDPQEERISKANRSLHPLLCLNECPGLVRFF